MSKLQDMFGLGFAEMRVDPDKYRGTGRPRKGDYTPIGDLLARYQLRVNKAHLERIQRIKVYDRE